MVSPAQSESLLKVQSANASGCRDSHGYRLLIVSLSAGLALAACHTRPILQEPAAAQNPMDRIAVQVMAAGASRRCATVRLLTGPKIKIPMLGCLAKVGDDLLLLPGFDSSRSHLGRRSPMAGTARDRRRAVEALQAQLNKQFGVSDDCLTRTQYVKEWESLQRQWHDSTMIVQVLEGSTGIEDPEAGIFVEYIKGPISCEYS